MTAGSLFTGIGGFDLGFQQAGIHTVWMAEKEPFCQALLRTHFPDAELFGDVSYVTKQSARAVDILTAGFPCQDLSVAGKRAGLEGARSGLFWEVVRILGELRPTWFVLENVPGLFSSGEGRDFATVLNALDELGYGLAWRVFNSQFFGVAQRRRRVFIVGRFGKPCPAEVLFESKGCGGDSETGGKAWPDVAGPLTIGAGVTGNSAGNEDDYNLAVFEPHHDEHEGRGASFRETDKHPSIRGPHGADNPLIAFALPSEHRGVGNGEEYIVASLSGMGSGGPDDNDGQASRIISFRTAQTGANGIGVLEDGTTHTLDGTGESSVCTPTHAGRVRSFASLPEGLDSARYRALGNAVTASVARWIGNRILECSR